MGSFLLSFVLFWPPLRLLRLKPTLIISVSSSPPRRTFITTTGRSIKNQDNSWSTAISMNQRTGSVPESASTPGSAEAPDNAKDKAGAMVTTPARRSTSELLDHRMVYTLKSRMFNDEPASQCTRRQLSIPRFVNG